ncbi:MAG: TerB family tellurite resistance protein [Gloeomargaritaceae cyanobacterium C42_A2020_066]|nr:TerB family tellurite resistance protein [Gloeomargaritaceae cyanobacterium C42_A2020_066]
MNLLRVVASLSWSDGELSPEEAALMIDRFSELFAPDVAGQDTLRAELQDYVAQNIPLEELVPKLASQAEKELVLGLGYAVICASSRDPGEDLVNEEEQAAYTKLVNLLELPPETVVALEASVNQALDRQSILDLVMERVHQFFQG